MKRRKKVESRQLVKKDVANVQQVLVDLEKSSTKENEQEVDASIPDIAAKALIQEPTHAD